MVARMLNDFRGFRGLVLMLALLVPSSAIGQAVPAPANTHDSEALAASDRGHRGVLAVRGDIVLAEENADRLFVPASVHKLIVAAAALDLLGPDHSMRTPVLGRFSTPGVVGDLVVVGAGDPTWNDFHYDGDPRAAVRGLAALLKERGVNRVDGDVVVDASRFPGRQRPIEWTWADAALGYGAAPSALAIDRNVVWVEMAPSKVLGGRATISGDPAIEWVNLTTTVTETRHGRGTIDFEPAWGTPRVIVRGEFPISEPRFRIELAAPNPLERAGAALRDALVAQGIEVAGTVRVVDRDATAGLDELAAWQSPPLSEWLWPLLGDSSNWYAEMVLRQLAYQGRGEGRLDLGVDLLTEFLEQRVGAAPGSFLIDDGSGLSAANLMSPRAVVALLRFVWAQKWRELFVHNLANGERGTLAGGWGKLPPIAAKTGTLRETQALAGVLVSAGEAGSSPARDPVFFAVFLNHRLDQRADLKAEIGRELWRWYRWQ